MKLPIVVTLLGAAAVASLSTPVLSQTPPEGSRYFGLPRYYKSEISVTEAYLAMKHSQGFREKADEPKAVLIDNRSLREYASGHPEYAYNVPFPTVSGLGVTRLRTRSSSIGRSIGSWTAGWTRPS